MDETYYDKAGVVLHTPISAFGGEKDDEADESAILEWGKYRTMILTTGYFREDIFI